MKKIILKTKNLSWILSALIVISFASCRKDNSMGFTPGTGAPTITSVHTLSKTDTAARTTTVTTYDTSGNVSTTVNGAPNLVTKFDSVTTSGTKGNYYVIYGTNLGSTTTITFNGVVAYFNRALITDHSLIVSIPNSVPTTGTAATNKLVVTTLHGSATYNFTVLSPPPTITSTSDYDFWGGYQVTLSGVGFSTVTAVGLVGTTATCTIISETDAQLTIQFPSTTVNTTNLVFSYSSGGKTATVTSTAEFNDLDNAYNIFAFNNLQNGWQNHSWSYPSGPSTNASHSGTSSFMANYPAGAWQIEGFDGYYAPNSGIQYSPDYKYLTFWVKGGVANHTLVLVGDQMVGGWGQVQNANAYAAQLIPVPANVWTYFKIPLGPPSSTSPALLNFWATGSPGQSLGFFLQGMPGDVNEVLYFDEVAFVK